MNFLVTILSVNLLAGGESIQKANAIERIVRFEYRLFNPSEKAQDVEIYMALPQDNERQEVPFVLPEPGYKDILKDRYGNKIVHYLIKGMKPGEVLTRGWMAAVRVHAAVYLPSTEVQPLTAGERAHYTQDKVNYQIHASEILKVRDSLMKEEMGNQEKTFSIFNFLINHITYFRDDHWDPAPVVLKNRKGSCSEFNYTFISLLRSCGIPCRYTGGLILTTNNSARYDQKIHEDAVFHRWTEIYLDDYGWYPADASRGSGAIKRFGNYLDLWGRVPSGSLQLYRGDGGNDSYIGWNYIGLARGQGIRKATVCFWVEVPELSKAVETIKTVTAKEPSSESLSLLAKDSLNREILFFMKNRIEKEQYPQLLEALHKSRHPSAIYYSLYCGKLGMEVPPSLQLSQLVDAYLKSEIEKRLGQSKRSWGNFEYWWRKARPEILYDGKEKVFVLGNKDIYIH